MKKTLLFICIAFISTTYYAQDPVIQNRELSNIERTGTTNCSCAGWMNKDLGDQLESSSWNSSTSFGAKFDEIEADIMYQEIAVLANTDYKFTFIYNFEDKIDTEPATSLEFRILAGTGYIADYTPEYPAAVDGQSRDFGYEDITVVENAANNLASTIIANPGDKDFRTGELTFNSGSNTSIAIFGRGTGRPNTVPQDASDSRPWTWSSGGSEIRIDEVNMTNESTASVNDVFSSQISIYPNPAKEFVQISTNETITGIAIYNLIGKKVISSNNLINNKIDVSNLSKGIYVLKVMSNNLLGSRKIIIE
ncbi:T9SS type A sorting domain-containing protein [Polaribacter sp.]|uniref:T9SS type A sorting domain-containing protein n=1 Tax=Polaribacter sp. TaxID=1920175 RepID=UPI003EF1F4C0